jgi:preprotein translocase subunit SecD
MSDNDDDAFSKVGEAITDTDGAKDKVNKASGLIKTAIKGTKKQKKDVYIEPSRVLDSVIPYGDEKSIKRTIGAGMLAVLLIGVFSIFAAAFLLFATAFTEMFGYLIALVIFAAAAAIIIGLIGFFFITNPRHEKGEDDDIRKRLGEK